MVNFEKVTSLDGVANGIRFICTDKQISEIRKKTALSEYSVKAALRLNGAPSTITRVVLELAKSNNQITLV